VPEETLPRFIGTYWGAVEPFVSLSPQETHLQTEAE
jgi:hypothetical protein